MSLFELIAFLLTLSALFSYLNHRYLKLPTTIGLMLIALLFSLGLLALAPLGIGIETHVAAILHRIAFDQALLHGMLSFLLFAGALHVDLGDLSRQKWVIAALATVGVLSATLLTASMAWLVFGWLGIELAFIWCLVFGALIAPTDPIAVLGILRNAGASRTLTAKITGESLFNDGIAVVVFLIVLGIATGQGDASPTAIAGLFLREAFGGALFGVVTGGLAYLMLARVDNYQVEVLITLALCAGGYAMAEALHLSAPIAVVVAGLLIGNHGRLLAMTDRTREHLDTFWELVDEVLNAVLFLLIGMELLVLAFRSEYLLAGLVMIPAVLLARLISVGAPMLVLRRFREFSPHAIKILTWGGLRGGISVALALSLPDVPAHDPLVAVTYILVVFSILVQGLTIGPLVRRTRV